MKELKDLEARAKLVTRKAYDDFWINLIDCSQVLQNLVPVKRRLWIIDVVRDLHRKQGGLCALCSLPLEFSEIDVDHKIPFCYGGGNESTNIQLAHNSCNRSKRAEVNPHDLLRYLEDRYMNINQSN